MTEQFAAYLPHIRRRWLDEQAAWETHRRQACRAARRATAVLYEQFAAERVMAFGSLTHTGPFDEQSDIVWLLLAWLRNSFSRLIRR